MRGAMGPLAVSDAAAQQDDQVMTTQHLPVDPCTYLVRCPRQGTIDVEWCVGCPRRVRIEQAEGRTVVVCDPGEHPPDHELWAGLLRPPAPFRIDDR
jgi:hypothetical protein